MHFWKMHGLGNDFILVDERDRAPRSWAELAPGLCDRHFGIGADGVLVVLPSTVADARMRIFNSDGSEAEMCGNGIRCYAMFLAERGGLKAHLSIETMAGIKEVRIGTVGNRVESIEVNMGQPVLEPARVPVALQAGEDHLAGPPTYPEAVLDYPLAVGDRRLGLTFVSMGNPHAVAFVGEAPDTFPLESVGPLVERHPLFPARTNFEVCHVENRQRMRVRVWERGAGATLACGTGACASVVAARLHGLVGDDVQVVLPGGPVEIRWAGSGDVFMKGPATLVFEGDTRD